jgi:hypothetical protein
VSTFNSDQYKNEKNEIIGLIKVKFRKKPVIIEAIRWDGKEKRALSIANFMGESGCTLAEDGSIEIETLEGPMKASPGDWIIKGVAGEFYPCKPHIFEATYEPAE